MNGVAGIGNMAFLNCGALKNITSPDSVKTIGDSAFNGCSALESVTLGNGVTNIMDMAFNLCTSLTSIIYSGSTEQWNAITKGRSWNGETGDYTITCANGTIAKEW